GLSLVVGVAVVEALESLGYPGVELKWPNDLYYQGRKLAGILVEMSGSAGASCHLVIGIGLNLAMPSQQGEKIDQAWSE
ncbi:biotin--[acetyl-CoA-carboxylase] synthetase, partial [Aeromonas allosaccharophila]